MTLTFKTVIELRKALSRAEAAHHEFVNEGGEDYGWAEWYAEFMSTDSETPGPDENVEKTAEEIGLDDAYMEAPRPVGTVSSLPVRSMDNIRQDVYSGQYEAGV